MARETENVFYKAATSILGSDLSGLDHARLLEMIKLPYFIFLRLNRRVFYTCTWLATFSTTLITPSRSGGTMKTSTSLSVSGHHGLIVSAFPQILTWRMDFQS